MKRKRKVKFSRFITLGILSLVMVILSACQTQDDGLIHIGILSLMDHNSLNAAER